MVTFIATPVEPIPEVRVRSENRTRSRLCEHEYATWFRRSGAGFPGRASTAPKSFEGAHQMQPAAFADPVDRAALGQFVPLDLFPHHRHVLAARTFRWLSQRTLQRVRHCSPRRSRPARSSCNAPANWRARQFDFQMRPQAAAGTSRCSCGIRPCSHGQWSTRGEGRRCRPDRISQSRPANKAPHASEFRRREAGPDGSEAANSEW